MYCNQCGKENYDEYDSEEYYEEKEVKVTEKKGEERKDFDKKDCFKPCHKPEPKCNEWEEDYVCKFTSKCYPKKPCCSCCNKR